MVSAPFCLLKIRLSPSPQNCINCFNEIPFKNDEKCFLLRVKVIKAYLILKKINVYIFGHLEKSV